MLGHVTSSYRSAALGRTFALALVARRPGADRPDPVRTRRGRAGAGDGHRQPSSTTRRAAAVMAETMTRVPPRRSPLASATSRFDGAAGRRCRCAELPLLDPARPAPRPERAGRAPPWPRCWASPCPSSACTAVTAGDVSVLWLGPDEWLVVAPADRSDLLASDSGRRWPGTVRWSTCPRSARRSRFAVPTPATCSRTAAPPTCTRGSLRRAPACRPCSALAGVVLVVRDDRPPTSGCWCGPPSPATSPTGSLDALHGVPRATASMALSVFDLF